MDIDGLGERLIARRKRKGYTQVTLATALDLSQSTISDWERGTICPTLKQIDAICELLGCTPTWLVGIPRRTAANG